MTHTILKGSVTLANENVSIENFGAYFSVNETPFAYTLSVIGGKWKMLILYLLYHHNVIRYNELQRFIGTITYKTLSVQLKELEADDLVIRTEYPQIPPKVEYSLSEKGKSLIPIMDAMCNWGVDHTK